MAFGVGILALSLLCGSLSAFFLAALEAVTQARFAHPWLILCLPLLGLGTAWLYHRHGGKSHEGNDLIIDEIHVPGGGVPLRMTPLVLLGSLATHLGGGSAGREGTAVQMGGSLASELNRRLGLDHERGRLLLMAGIAGGFGAVFGTPLAGAVFAMEVLHQGRIEHKAALPCLAAALGSHLACLAWGIRHSDYHVGLFAAQAGWGLASFDLWLLAKAALAALAFGLTARAFALGLHGASDLLKRALPSWWLRPLAGGMAVVALSYAVGSTDYLGLGVSSPDPQAVTVLSCFREAGAHAFSWLEKLGFTIVTLASGFKGGEVTPLFFIGAALGNSLSLWLHAPAELFAGLGLISVFSGATKTPLACTLLGIELFGGSYAIYFALACYLAWRVSGIHGIYKAQRKPL